MSFEGMTKRQLELAKRAAKKLWESQQKVELEPCPNCRGNAMMATDGTAKDGPESCGNGHAVFAPCGECGGTGMMERNADMEARRQ